MAQVAMAMFPVGSSPLADSYSHVHGPCQMPWLCIITANPPLALAMAITSQSSFDHGVLPVQRTVDVNVRAPATVSPVRPMTPADHGARKAQAEPSTQSPEEEPVELVASAVKQQPSQAPITSHAEHPLQRMSETYPQPPAGPVANVRHNATPAAGVEMIPSHPATESAPETGRKQPAVPPAQPAAQVPPHAPAQPPNQASAAAPAAPASLASAELPEQQFTDKAPAEASAAPKEERKGSQTPRRAQRDVAALDELHAYVLSCGGTLDEGWRVQFPKRGSGHARPTYLPPKV